MLSEWTLKNHLVVVEARVKQFVADLLVRAGQRIGHDSRFLLSTAWNYYTTPYLLLERGPCQEFVADYAYNHLSTMFTYREH